jgi:hypothetical protein
MYIRGRFVMPLIKQSWKKEEADTGESLSIVGRELRSMPPEDV